jgi:hypothetical protein
MPMIQTNLAAPIRRLSPTAVIILTAAVPVVAVAAREAHLTRHDGVRFLREARDVDRAIAAIRADAQVPGRDRAEGGSPPRAAPAPGA